MLCSNDCCHNTWIFLAFYSKGPFSSLSCSVVRPFSWIVFILLTLCDIKILLLKLWLSLSPLVLFTTLVFLYSLSFLSICRFRFCAFSCPFALSISFTSSLIFFCLFFIIWPTDFQIVSFLVASLSPSLSLSLPFTDSLTDSIPQLQLVIPNRIYLFQNSVIFFSGCRWKIQKVNRVFRRKERARKSVLENTFSKIAQKYSLKSKSRTRQREKDGHRIAREFQECFCQKIERKHK